MLDMPVMRSARVENEKLCLIYPPLLIPHDKEKRKATHCFPFPFGDVLWDLPREGDVFHAIVTWYRSFRPCFPQDRSFIHRPWYIVAQPAFCNEE